MYLMRFIKKIDLTLNYIIYEHQDDEYHEQQAKYDN